MIAEMHPAPQALDIEGVCHRYSIGRTTVFAEIKSGRLRATKIGRSTRIDVRDADAWWDAQRGDDDRRTQIHALGGILRYARTVLGVDRFSKIMAEARARAAGAAS